MALSDEMKLDIAKTKFKEKLDSYDDWTDFIAFLSAITKTKIKNFLKNAIQAEADKLRIESTDRSTMADDEEALKTEIDAL